ncbi:MAG: carboxypeptidase, partial [Parvularculaceae bacterium]|nr:carboxypeptidase [Parvularculaceae bacterium]
MRRFVLFCAFWLGVAPATASLPFTDEDYAIDIPTFEAVLGHAAGEEITTSGDAIRYLERLRDAAPDRVKVVPYAESWQGRRLVYAIIASKENMAKLDTIQADLATLSDGKSLTQAQRARKASELPAVSWLGYGVHGNELAPTDAGMALAYHLLAAKNDPQVEKILAETIVIIDPIQNPDGRDRFLHHFESARGLTVLGDTYAAERDEPWPGGRLNHALFDMNRDWFTLSQPETRGRVSAMLAWHPTVVVDAHEMGSNSTFFFAPAADPFSPFITQAQREGHEIIGRANAEAFD